MLNPHQIDLWLCREDDIHSPFLLSQYERWLPDEEKQRRARYKFEADQHRFLVTRALMRSTLSHYHPEVLPEDWVFRTNAHGRPSIANDIALPVSFNLSHTKGLSVLAISSHPLTGVDVEHSKRQNSFEEQRLAHRFFSPSETASLLALPHPAHKERFYRLWTLKEAYIKACGKGLAIPLDHFYFDFLGSGGIRIAFSEELNDSPAEWQFWQYLTDDDFLIALACKAFPSRIHHINTYEVIPNQASHTRPLTPKDQSR